MPLTLASIALYAILLVLLFRLRPRALGPVLGVALALSLIGLTWFTGVADATRPHADQWITRDPRWDRQCHTLASLTFVSVVTLMPLASLWLARPQTRDVLDQGIVVGIASVLAFFAGMVASLFVGIQDLACDTL